MFHPNDHERFAMDSTGSDTDFLDYSSDEWAELGYEPEDPLLYAIELGMAIEPPELTEEDLTRTYADTYHHLITVKSTLTRISEDFIYNDWAASEPVVDLELVTDDNYFQMQKIIIGPPHTQHSWFPFWMEIKSDEGTLANTVPFELDEFEYPEDIC